MAENDHGSRSKVRSTLFRSVFPLILDCSTAIEVDGQPGLHQIVAAVRTGVHLMPRFMMYCRKRLLNIDQSNEAGLPYSTGGGNLCINPKIKQTAINSPGRFLSQGFDFKKTRRW